MVHRYCLLLLIALALVQLRAADEAWSYAHLTVREGNRSRGTEELVSLELDLQMGAARHGGFQVGAFGDLVRVKDGACRQLLKSLHPGAAQPEKASLSVVLDALGSDGWELVSVLREGSEGAGSTVRSTEFYLKRRRATP